MRELARGVDAPVIIVGGGPAGLTLAMELARHEVRSIVIERRARDEAPSPRCNTTNARSMEIFRRLGCADAVRAAGLPADFNTDVVYMTRLTGRELVRYERSTPADVRAGTLHGIAAHWPTPEPQHFISQIYLEPVLREHACTAYGVDLREGWECERVEQDAAGVRVWVRCLASGERQTLHGAYAIGADGGGSAVRRGIGARLEGIPEIGNAASLYVEAPRLRELAARAPGWMYRFASGGLLVAIDGADRWLLHLNGPPGRSFAGVDIRPAAFAAIGEPFEFRAISDVRWTARAMVASRYRRDRVFVIGDAAHIWIPMGGFGMNAAIADAATLGWMLAGTLAGWLDPKILDVFEAERSPVGSLVATHAAKWARDLAFFRLGQAEVDALEADAQACAQLGARIRAINLGEFECPGMQLGLAYANSPAIVDDGTPAPPFSLETYVESSRPGVRAPHVRRADGAALFDAFGRGFSLLRIGADAPAGATLVAHAQQRGVPLTTINVLEPDAPRAYDGYSLVLVRPDGHVAWHARVEPSAGEAAAVLDRVTGALVPQLVCTTVLAQPVRFALAATRHMRWLQGKLHVCDRREGRVVAYDIEGGTSATVAVVPHGPTGIAPTSDSVLVASSGDRRILEFRQTGAPTVYADVSGVAGGDLRAIARDAEGRVYVADEASAARPDDWMTPSVASASHRVVLVDADRSARVVLDGLPPLRALDLMPDGTTLLLATDGAGVMQSRIDRRTGVPGTPFPFIDAAGDCPAMALDRSGGVWLCGSTGEVERYDRAGRLTARLRLADGTTPTACALDEDQATLYVAGVEGGLGTPGQGASTLTEGSLDEAVTRDTAHVRLFRADVRSADLSANQSGNLVPA